MVTCGFCGHPGVHATITREVGNVKYCTGCPSCQEELRRLSESGPDAENPSTDRPGPAGEAPESA